MTPSWFLPPRGARASAAGLCAAAAIAAIALTGCGSGSSHSSSSSSPSASSTTAAASATSSTPTASVVKSTSGGFTSQVFASGISITFGTGTAKTPVNQPDDITKLGSDIFVGFQNNVGPQGEPTPAGNQGAGNRDSTIVAFSSTGSKIAQWQVRGHVDGVTADPTIGRVIITTNEDANPHLFTIAPSSPQAVQYRVPALPSHGGLDAVSIYHGKIMVSASAPGTSGKAAPQASYPAVYDVSLNTGAHTASVRGMFGDEASAKRVNPGTSGTARLALADPDSNFVVPAYAPRFGGQFMVTSQGDYQNIFAAGTSAKQLSVLKLSQSIDDSAWASGRSSTLYVTDGSADLIYKITGPFQKGEQVVGVTPCDAGNAPASCPVLPRFPNNYLGVVNQSTGKVTKFSLTSPAINPAGLLFAP